MLAIAMCYLWLTGADVYGAMWLAGLLTICEVLVMASISLMWTTVSTTVGCRVGFGNVCVRSRCEQPAAFHVSFRWLETVRGSCREFCAKFGVILPIVIGPYMVSLFLFDDMIALPYGALWVLLLLVITIAVFNRKQL